MTKTNKRQQSTPNGKPEMSAAPATVPVSRSVLEGELESLRQQRASALADLQRIAGAEQMAQHLLSKIVDAEMKEKFERERPPAVVRK